MKCWRSRHSTHRGYFVGCNWRKELFPRNHHLYVSLSLWTWQTQIVILSRYLLVFSFLSVWSTRLFRLCHGILPMAWHSAMAVHGASTSIFKRVEGKGAYSTQVPSVQQWWCGCCHGQDHTTCVQGIVFLQLQNCTMLAGHGLKVSHKQPDLGVGWVCVISLVKMI